MENNKYTGELSQDEWGQIIASIYEAALLPDYWNEVLLKIARPIHCHTGQLAVLTNAFSHCYFNSTKGVDPNFFSVFEEEVMLGIHTRANFARTAPSMSVITDHMHSSEAEMARDPIYQKGTPKKYDAEYYGGVVLEPGSSCTSVIGVFRSRSSGHFDAQECNYLESLAPHIRRSIELMRYNRLNGLLNGISSTLDSFETGFIVLDRQAHIAAANSKALAIINRKDGIYDQNKKIALSDRQAQKVLSRDIRHLVTAESFSIAPKPQYIKVERPGSLFPYYLFVVPLTSKEDSLAGLAGLMYIIDPEARSPDIKTLLGNMLNLTAMEADLVAALCNGSTVKQYAESNKVSIEAPRYHLKNIFSKLGVSRQSELITLALNTVGKIAMISGALLNNNWNV